MNRFLLSLLFLLQIIFYSCGSYKHIPYFQDLDRGMPYQEKVENFSPLTIQPADILGINVNSRNPESSSIFNYNLNRVNGNNYDHSSDNPVTGYLVNQNGEIVLPLIGALKVADLSTTQLQEKMNQLLQTYYKDPVVSVRLLNFKISIFGDVQRPDVYTLTNNRTTITQALSLAGDLNITALRSNITLIREENGKRHFIPLDLTSKGIFSSPYYYLKNNDEIYVQPDRTKYASVDRGYKISALILSGLSIIAIVLSNLYR